MKKKKTNIRVAKALLVSITLLLFSSCLANKPQKPLIGGIKESAELQEVITRDENNSETTEREVAGKGNEGLEIPAPLKNSGELILKRTGYVVSYNAETKLPNWVAWHLTAERCTGNAKRQQKEFHEDEDVPTPRATDWDYYNSRFDRGHMCPAGDNKWSERAMHESFLFTNICPQNPNLNRGDWNEMENQCRKWAKEYGDVYIVCGPILYKGKHKTIGKNKVVVPEAFFKVVLCMNGTP